MTREASPLRARPADRASPFTLTPVIFLFLAQTEEDGGNKLFVCPQEAALQASGPRAHPGDHAAGELGGNISSCLHSRRGAAKARIHVQVAL